MKKMKLLSGLILASSLFTSLVPNSNPAEESDSFEVPTPVVWGVDAMAATAGGFLMEWYLAKMTEGSLFSALHKNTPLDPWNNKLRITLDFSAATFVGYVTHRFLNPYTSGACAARRLELKKNKALWLEEYIDEEKSNVRRGVEKIEQVVKIYEDILMADLADANIFKKIYPHIEGHFGNPWPLVKYYNWLCEFYQHVELSLENVIKHEKEEQKQAAMVSACKRLLTFLAVRIDQLDHLELYKKQAKELDEAEEKERKHKHQERKLKATELSAKSNQQLSVVLENVTPALQATAKEFEVNNKHYEEEIKRQQAINNQNYDVAKEIKGAASAVTLNSATLSMEVSRVSGMNSALNAVQQDVKEIKGKVTTSAATLTNLEKRTAVVQESIGVHASNTTSGIAAIKKDTDVLVARADKKLVYQPQTPTAPPLQEPMYPDLSPYQQKAN